MIKIVLTTIDSADSARQLAQILVTERLAACVNIIPEVRSVYKWEGRLEESAELLLVIKTTPECLPALIDRIREAHPYDLPEAVALSVEDGLPDYLDWVMRQVRVPEDPLAGD